MLKGIDCSHHQGKIDWKKVKADFVFYKCTESTNYIDPTYKDFKKNWKGYSGCYHFARGGNAVKEADWFLKNAQHDLLFLDWEIEHADPVGWSKQFIKRIEEKGKTCWLYTNDARAIKYAWPKEWKYWIARYADYTGTYYPDFEPKFKNWSIYQYTSRGKVDGITGNVDMNLAKELPNFNNNPMKFFSQKDYPQTLGTCLKETIAKSGCFITSLCNLNVALDRVAVPPDVLNTYFIENNCYTSGCLLNAFRAAKLLEMKYEKTLEPPQGLCLIETDHFKKVGVPQHFCLYNTTTKARVDPLDLSPSWEPNNYPIVSYRVFTPVVNKIPEVVNTVVNKPPEVVTEPPEDVYKPPETVDTPPTIEYITLPLSDYPTVDLVKELLHRMKLFN